MTRSPHKAWHSFLNASSRIKIIRCSNFAVFREWEALRVSGSIFSVNSTTGGQHEREHFYNGDLNTGSNIFARFPIYRLVFFSSLRLVFHLFFYSISSCCDEIVGSWSIPEWNVTARNLYTGIYLSNKRSIVTAESQSRRYRCKSRCGIAGLRRRYFDSLMPRIPNLVTLCTGFGCMGFH